MRLYNFSQFIQEAKNPCWDGYKQVGLKKKNGKMVPNCVQIKESEDEESTYSFDELSPQAKENAIQNNREIAIEGFDWWDPIIEGFTENMEKIGMGDVKCEFSGFYSQGDGASFTGKIADNKKFLDALEVNPFRSEKAPLAPEKFEVAFIDFCDRIYISIDRDSSRYYHHNTISANVELDGDDEIELDLGFGALIEFKVSKLCDEIEPAITTWARASAKELYNDLEKYYEEQTSDETIAEDLRSGGYQFDEDGNLV